MNVDQSNGSQSPAESGVGIMHVVVNGQSLTLPVGTTVADVLASQSVRTELVVVEVNMEIVSKAQHSHTVLKSGDQVEVVTLVGGG